MIKSAVAQGDTVYIPTFGNFGPKRRAAKVARTLKHNTAMQVDAHTIPTLRPISEFVNQVRQRENEELWLEQAQAIGLSQQRELSIQQNRDIEREHGRSRSLSMGL